MTQSLLVKHEYSMNHINFWLSTSLF